MGRSTGVQENASIRIQNKEMRRKIEVQECKKMQVQEESTGVQRKHKYKTEIKKRKDLEQQENKVNE